MNKSKAGAQTLEKFVEEKKMGHNNTANPNEKGTDNSALNCTKGMPKNDDDDDLMKRSDFRYFYSGRKLL